ncbi:MAG: hypothetical protein PHE49_07355 [bacterium]|nr:hypothetical protein [bacterium]
MRLKNALMFVAVFFCLCQNIFAQQNMEDVVYLKNGSIIKGIIVEQVFGVSIKLKTKDGNIFVFKTQEVEKITKEDIPKEEIRREEIKNVPGTYTSIKEEKSPVVACLLSFVIPGVGQFYNGEVGKGIAQEALILGGYVLAFTAGFGTETYYDSYYDYYYTTPTLTAWYPIGLGIGVLSQLWSIIDAPVSANRINRERAQRGYGHLFEFDGNKYKLGMDIMPNHAQVTLHF